MALYCVYVFRLHPHDDMRRFYFDAVLLGSVVMNEIARIESYREDLQSQSTFLFVFSCILTIAVLSLSLIVWSWQKDDSERLERLERLHQIKQPQEPCGCCPPLGVLSVQEI